MRNVQRRGYPIGRMSSAAAHYHGQRIRSRLPVELHRRVDRFVRQAINQERSRVRAPLHSDIRRAASIRSRYAGVHYLNNRRVRMSANLTNTLRSRRS